MKTLHILTAGLMMNITVVGSSSTNNQNSQLSLNIIEILNPSCNSSCNGTITVEAEGGSEPYSYNWNTFPNQSTPQAVNLASGVYFIEVKDAEGEVFFQSIELMAPEKINADKNTVQPNQKITVVDLEFTMDGGNGPFDYEFNGQNIKHPKIENLSIGIHTLKVTDANDCSMIQYIQVFEIEGENESSDLLGWTIYDQMPIEVITIERVEFSKLIPIENSPEEILIVFEE